MSNILKREKREMIIRCLVDGNSIRGTERIVGCHRDTVMKLGVQVGHHCECLMNDLLVGLTPKRIQVDEIWAYCGKKQRQVTQDDDPEQSGDFYTWVALDPDSKLVPTYLVGKRTAQCANHFMADLAARIKKRIQLTSDGLSTYTDATERAFGGEVDFGMLVKVYEIEELGRGRYSPSKVKEVDKKSISGSPHQDHISTSMVERQNLTMRMCMRRFTRLTNAFSKKRENLEAAVSLHFAYYNFVRIHKTLQMTPAMAAGVTSRIWAIDDLLP